jgi:hypothetical protein
MLRDYLAGELSVRLELLEQATGRGALPTLRRLRHQVETCPLAELTMATTGALAMADGLCWDSLARGDLPAFSRQAGISAELRQFGICACLLAEG